MSKFLKEFFELHTLLSWEIEGIVRENMIEKETLRNVEKRRENLAKEREKHTQILKGTINLR